MGGHPSGMAACFWKFWKNSINFKITRLTNRRLSHIINYVVEEAQIAQLVEQRTENPRVAGSIPALGISCIGIVSYRHRTIK